MSALIIEYHNSVGWMGADATAVNVLLGDEVAEAVSMTDQHTLVGELQTPELIALVKHRGKPGEMIGIDVPEGSVLRFARQLDAMVFTGQLQ